MLDIQIVHPFKTPFLSNYYYVPDILAHLNDDVYRFDQELANYEKAFLNPEVENSLISNNELFTSFAISKAENSQLTLQEAKDVYALVTSNSDYEFISTKLKVGEILNEKDHDKLEFYNIAKTFRTYNLNRTNIFENIDADFILLLHQQLTQGLDVFKTYLPDFTVYRSGKWRNNDLIRVGNFIPAPYAQIPAGITELIQFIKNNRTPSAVALFHTALYALHPFNNGNKRVCRVLEHLLLRGIDINSKNLYSTSYYYHLEKQRYYKYLLYSLEKYNLNHFALFIGEALLLSIVSVLKTGIEVKRQEFILTYDIEDAVKRALKPLIKRNEVQFKQLLQYSKSKIARQTLVNYLGQAVERGVITRRQSGKNVFYHLNINIPEWETLREWIEEVRQNYPYIPDEFRLV